MTEEMRAERLAEPAWLAENLDNPGLRIVEVASLLDPDSYHSGHIPGAVLWPWKETLWQPEKRDFPTPGGFAELMQRSGIGPDTTIVFYSNLIQYAAYAFWVCFMRGHRLMKVFNGNKNRWVQAGCSLSDVLPQVKETAYPLRPVDEGSRIKREDVLAGLHDPNRVLLDLRSLEEYRGERVSPPWFAVDHGAQCKGRIPGARHIFYADLLDANERLKAPAQLKEAFTRVGALPDKEIVTYCRLGHRGSLAWFVLTQILGYGRVRVYDGSWTEWGSMVGMPIVIETQQKGAGAPLNDPAGAGCGSTAPPSGCCG